MCVDGVAGLQAAPGVHEFGGVEAVKAQPIDSDTVTN